MKRPQSLPAYPVAAETLPPEVQAFLSDENFAIHLASWLAGTHWARTIAKQLQVDRDTGKRTKVYDLIRDALFQVALKLGKEQAAAPVTDTDPDMIAARAMLREIAGESD